MEMSLSSLSFGLSTYPPGKKKLAMEFLLYHLFLGAAIGTTESRTSVIKGERRNKALRSIGL